MSRNSLFLPIFLQVAVLHPALADGVADCEGALPYLQTVEVNKDDHEFRYVMHKWLCSSTYEQAKSTFGVSAAIPTDLITIPVGIKKEDYEVQQQRLCKTDDVNIKQSDASFALKKFMSSDALDAYRKCLLAIKSENLICEWAPKTADAQSATLIVKWRDAGVAKIDTSHTEITPISGVSIGNKPAAVSLLGTQFEGPTPFLFTRTGDALQSDLRVAITATMDIGSRLHTQSCVATLPGIVRAPPKPVPPCQANDLDGKCLKCEGDLKMSAEEGNGSAPFSCPGMVDAGPFRFRAHGKIHVGDHTASGDARIRIRAIGSDGDGGVQTLTGDGTNWIRYSLEQSNKSNNTWRVGVNTCRTHNETNMWPCEAEGTWQICSAKAPCAWDSEK